jgi:Ca2+-binding EF-hand superfamily protein
VATSHLLVVCVDFFHHLGGDIDNDELGDVFKSMGMKPSAKELAQMVKELDTDLSGSISFTEFLHLMVAPK